MLFAPAFLALVLTSNPTEEAQHRAASRSIVALMAESMKASDAQTKLDDVPKELMNEETFWVGSKPILEWSDELRKFANDSLFETSKKDPNARAWLLTPDNFKDAKLSFGLIASSDFIVDSSTHGYAFNIASKDTYNADLQPLGRFIDSLNAEQRTALIRNHMRMPLRSFGDSSIKALEDGVKTFGSQGLPDVSKADARFDFYIWATFSKGKERYSTLVARPFP